MTGITCLIILFGIFLLLNIVQVKFSSLGSDHAYHVSLIKAIKDNKHRFVRSHPQIIGEKYFAYPQFYHWLLSFFPATFVKNQYWILNGIINFAQLVSFLIFAQSMYTYLDIDTNLNEFVLHSGLIFILTPFSYAIWNARNKGISARGVGLLLGQVYLYLILLYNITGNMIYFVYIFISAFIILLSSQFAMQFVIISAPIFALIFKNPCFLMVPIFAFMMFYAIMPSVCSDFVKGQFWHKYLYSQYLAEVFILKLRYSIWRDIFFDFWVKLKVDLKKGLLYIYYNPLVSLLLGIPFLTMFMAYILGDSDIRSAVLETRYLYILAIPVIVSLLVFILTSFRKTRFLGEPERYLEFCIPQISLLGAFFFTHTYAIAYAILGICVLLIMGQLIVSWMIKDRATKLALNPIEDIAKYVIMKSLENGNRGPNTIRIFSNNGNIMKYVMHYENIVSLRTNLTSLFTGKLHFKDIYPDKYPYVSANAILTLINEFKIDWFILDTITLPVYDQLLTNSKTQLCEQFNVNHYKIYKVCLKA